MPTHRIIERIRSKRIEEQLELKLSKFLERTLLTLLFVFAYRSSLSRESAGLSADVSGVETESEQERCEER